MMQLQKQGKRFVGYGLMKFESELYTKLNFPLCNFKHKEVGQWVSKGKGQEKSKEEVKHV